MHRHVDNPGLNLDLLDLVNERRNAPSDLHTARRNSREHDFLQPGISLNDFVRNPSKRATNCLRLHYWRGVWWIVFWLIHAFPWRPHGIALKEQKNLGGGLFGARLLLSPLSPIGAVLYDPIEKSPFKADVFAGFFAFNPLMLQNLR